MAIALTPVREGELWAGATWTVEDEDVLAGLIARVAIGQARVAERILNEDGLIDVGYPMGGHEGARKLLEVGPTGDPAHRDGWMFQVISWIAAHRSGRPGVIRSPHMRHADKGLDGLMVEFDDTEIARVVISEEKATGNARTMVRDRVWPEFRDFETGRRDAELNDGVSTLLADGGYPNPDAVVAAILWTEKRAYRVAVTIDDTHASEKGLKALYKGYETAVSGEIGRRRAETFQVQDLRPWFESIAVKATAIINAEEAAINV
ncbi:hypothetical protein E2L08_08435 [Palleronia sediminis]|uniref:Uncharacterized protein n=2 Tax=Palleronia sediminis TaxID=2547833 RepID=A0A4R6A7K1_9RHOB|nr:hypothetical protein E2L08_08435 [Palleronia sediminis]